MQTSGQQGGVVDVGEIRIVVSETHGVVVHRFDIGIIHNARQRAHGWIIAVPAFDVRDGGLSVEQFPVVEGDALAQMEGELCAIVARFPAFREHRLDLAVDIFHGGS